MPELAEVEYYRRCWDCGLGERITKVIAHDGKRIFRTVHLPAMRVALQGGILQRSEARGKQMLFCFSNDLWLGLHLGMTGKLRAEPANFKPARHDHLVLRQKDRSLIFSDPRLFGRLQFHQGASIPDWWQRIPFDLTDRSFTQDRMDAFLERHRKLPIKATLLLQDGFPGIGNWMADEILWRSKLHPAYTSGELSPKSRRNLWKVIRFVCRSAMNHISADLSDPPAGWLFHERWHQGGKCPTHGILLDRRTIGGRTAVWCPKCQSSCIVAISMRE